MSKKPQKPAAGGLFKKLNTGVVAPSELCGAAMRQRSDRVGPLLLDLRFLVDHVLTDHGIVLFELQFVWGVLLVLIGRVVVTGAC